MKHSLRTLINASCAIIGSFLLLSSLTSNAQFTSGRLVVARYGATGQVSAPTSAGTPTFLDEFTTAGAPGITVVLPTTTVGSTNRMLSSGSATSEGQLNLSSDGTVLLLGGYDAAAGTATINSTAGINRVIARIDNSGTVSTTVLTTTDVTVTNNSYTTSNFRSVASVDGSRYWTGGNGNASTGGVRTILYSGSSVTPSIASQVSSTTTNVRVVKIFNGQIYYSTASGIFKVGSGLPVISGTTSTALFTMQTGNSSPHSFVFLDRDPSVPGPDVMYVADDGTGASGLRAIFKYYFNGISWISLGSAVHTVGISGLTGVVNGSTAELYGSTSGSIVKLTDNSSFSTPITG
ncbi:MAG TPA: hypothetical protein PLU53_15690, partial [Bacteroidia bacterium]|nr:hypothetical protein [Bacteroidia bacterium]